VFVSVQSDLGQLARRGPRHSGIDEKPPLFLRSRSIDDERLHCMFFARRRALTPAQFTTGRNSSDFTDGASITASDHT